MYLVSFGARIKWSCSYSRTSAFAHDVAIVCVSVHVCAHMHFIVYMDRHLSLYLYVLN